MCRAMMDYVHFFETGLIVTDLKTSGDIAGEDGIGKKIASLGYELSAAFYARGVRAITGKPAAFRFAFAETDPPYEVQAVELDGAAYEIGRRQVAAAIHLWRRCQIAGEWPGYPREIARVSLPPWHTASWEARETNDPALEGVDYGEPA